MKRQYELITNKMPPNDMPAQIFARDWRTAQTMVMKKLRKEEKIVSLKRVYW